MGSSPGYLVCEMTGMSELKIKNRPFGRQNFDIFCTLRETFFLNFDLVCISKILVDFFQILVDFHQILVENSGNRDPLRGKL